MSEIDIYGEKNFQILADNAVGEEFDKKWPGFYPERFPFPQNKTNYRIHYIDPKNEPYQTNGIILSKIPIDHLTADILYEYYNKHWVISFLNADFKIKYTKREDYKELKYNSFIEKQQKFLNHFKQIK